MAQVGAEEFAVLVDAGSLGQRVSRGPGPAAGPGGGTTADLGLFHDDDFQPVVGGRGLPTYMSGRMAEELAIPAEFRVREGGGAETSDIATVLHRGNGTQQLVWMW